jgi:uncharacterized cupredoxin-like copper-binding protein/predicted ester cyclase
MDGATPQPREITSTACSRRLALGYFGLGTMSLAALAGSRAQFVAAQTTPEPNSPEAVARQAIVAVNEALATGNIDGIGAAFASDVTIHPPHRSLVTGEPYSDDLSGLQQSLAGIHHVFPDATITIDELIASDNTVAARVTFRGTLAAATPSVGDEVGGPWEIGGTTFGHVEDGRIVEFWASIDPSAAIGLVGLLPPAGQVTTGAPEGHGNDGATVESPGHGHDATASAASVEAGAEEVAVTLTEFSIALAPVGLHAGQPYAFVVKNEGTVIHEFVIERSGAVHDPLMDGDRMAMLVGIGPGETRTLGWTFPGPGAYQLACHQPGHFEAGQVLAIDVAE